MTQHVSSVPTSLRRDLALWISMLLGPIAWFLNFQIIYGFAAVACKTGKLRMFVSCGITLAIVLAGVGLSIWLVMHSREREPDELGQRLQNRPHFMAATGLLLNLMFMLVVIAQTIASMMIDPCWD
jgi:hypothetical protein